MKKFVLDTNVLINDPKSLHKFGNHEIVIPLLVLEEIDGLKKRTDSTGQSAREVAREIDSLRQYGRLHSGIELPNGGRLRVLTHVSEPTWVQGKQINDHLILQSCIDLVEEQKRKKKSTKDVVLVTEDINLRILADSLGVLVDRYRNNTIEDISFYDQTQILPVSDHFLNDLFSNEAYTDTEGETVEHNLYRNEFVVLKSHSGNSGLAKYVGKESDFNVFIVVKEDMVYKVRPKNKEQHFALDALMDPDISLVVLAGKAGTGKTLLALAAGLEQVTEQKVYKKLTVTRPVVSMGQELGYLPGSLSEKLDPWMGPVYDNISFLFKDAVRRHKNADIGRDTVEFFKDQNWLGVEALQYIRGRSLPEQFVLIDEAQNLSSHEIKTIITRAGKGTKLVFTGDPYQIDSPYLDQYNNGITYIIDRFKEQACFACVTLHKGERSDLAELGARLL